MTVAKTARAKSNPLEGYRKGADGFIRFIKEVKPVILNEQRKYVPFELWDRVADDVVKAIDGNYRTVCFVFPRRHGKTLISAVYIVWRFMCFRNEDIGIVAQSEKQTIGTAFRLVRDCLLHTPVFKREVDAGNIIVNKDTIEFPAMGNTIIGYPNNPTTLLGKSMTVAQCSELHKARTTDTFTVLKGNIMDAANGVLLVDSTPGSKIGPLGLIYDLWKEGTDPTLFVSHVEYTDVEDAIRNAPAWLNTDDLRILERTMLPPVFRAEHLGQFSESSDMLFTSEIIAACRHTYDLDPKTIANGLPYAVGGGLDRAYPFSRHGDSTVTTCVAMVMQDEQPHFYVLDSRDILFSRAGGIKSAFLDYHRKWGMKHAALEHYNVSDIQQWCEEQSGFDSEIVSPTSERQSNAFTTLYAAASEGRLHIHQQFEKLFKEMETFTVRLEAEAGKSVAKFQHAPGKHDDALYSLAWAIYSLRHEELPAYGLNGIHCREKGPSARLCALNGGQHVPPCAEECKSFVKAHQLYERYKDKAGCAPLKLPEFIRYKVENTGIHSMPR